jgi:hypothetical protein
VKRPHAHGHSRRAGGLDTVAGTLFRASFCCSSTRATFNVTNISKRWLRRHLDAERHPPLGNRDTESFTKFVSPGKKRICFVGDSFTAGHGVNDMADRFTDRIRTKLDAAKPGKFVVANLGEPGWETSQIEAFVHSFCSTATTCRSSSITTE